MKSVNYIRKNCVFYRDSVSHPCDALKKLYCETDKDCPFFKTKRQAEKDKKRYPSRTEQEQEVFRGQPRRDIVIDRDAIKALLSDKQMSYTELGAKIGYSYRTIARNLCDELANFSFVIRVSDILGVTADKIMKK